MPEESGEIVARDVDGKVLLRRPLSPLELAEKVHGKALQVDDWRVHPACHNPPARFGTSSVRLGDGQGPYWCPSCQMTWTPDATSERLTAAMSRQGAPVP